MSSRIAPIYASIAIAATVPLWAASLTGPTENWGAKVAAAEQKRDARIREVRAIRRYVLHNPRWKTDAVMTAMMSYDISGQKHYEVLDVHAEGIQKTVLQRILDGEVEQSAVRNDDGGSINPENYDIVPIGEELLGGRRCMVVQLKPRRKSKMLLEGKAWIDMAEFAPVRVEGRPSKSLGFWVGKPYIVQDFRKVGDFWLSSRNQTVADVKMLGKTELTIDFQDYFVAPKTGDVLMACSKRPCSPHLFD